MRKLLLVILALFYCCLFCASAQDMRAPQDTSKTPGALRSGVLGPFQFEYISWQDNLTTASPEAAKMTRYADTPASNAFGQVDISLPIYTIQTRSLSLPIFLSYDCSGIRPDEISGVVGLGWSLHAGGVITREIVGQIDSGTIPQEYTSSNQGPNVAQFILLNNDTDYDRYFYNFCGHSGSFYYAWDASTMTTHIVPCEPTDLIISMDNNGFLIVDKEGTQYRFSQAETSSRILGSNDPDAPINNNSSLSYNINTTTAWHLTEIRSIDGADVISLNYQQLTEFSHVSHSYYRSVSFPYQYLGNGNYLTNFSGGWDPTPTFMTKEWSTTTTNTWHPYMVSLISFPGGSVSFAYTTYSQADGSGNNNRRSYPSFLSAITVSNANDGIVYNWSFTKETTGDYRTLLSSATKKGSYGATIEAWSFTYESPSSGMGENSVDLFGYYNGASNATKSFLRPYNDTYTVNFSVANRNYNSSTVGKLSLTSITTASGSKTRYFYESKGISSEGLSNLFSGDIYIGQRISRIDTYDLSGGTEILIRSRRFSYSDPGITVPKYGFQMGAFISTTEYNTLSPSSGQRPGYWYGTMSPVRICSIVYSDQSNLPGAPLESARIFYGTVEENIYENSLPVIKTVWEYNTAGAESTGGGGTVWAPSDSHDSQYTPYGAVSNHFSQRVPTYIPRNGSQSNPTTPLGYHFQDQNRPQLTEPVRVTSYKKTPNGQFTPVTQTEYSFSSVYRYFQTGLHANIKLSRNVNGYENNTICCLEDFDQQQVDRKIYYRRLTGRTDREYLDDGTVKIVQTTYNYDYSTTGRTSLYSGNTYFSSQTQVPAMGAILTPRQEIRVYDSDNTRTYTRNIIFPDELVGISGCGWAGTLSSLGYRSPVGEEIIPESDTAKKTGRYISWGQIPVSNWANGTNSSSTLLRPALMEVYRGGQDTGQTTTIVTVDSYGQPLQVTTPGLPVKTYAWGYNHAYPVAEMAGTTFCETRNALSSTQRNTLDEIGSAAILNSSQKSFMSNDLRTALSGTLVSTYTYAPLIGVASVEDPSGRQENYIYDGTGRLANVTDDSNYYVSSYSYALTNGGSGTPNSILSLTHTTASTSPTMGIIDVVYFDGLGRTIQSIAVGAATSGRDLVAPVVPDFLDREDARVYLPYPAIMTSSNSGTYRSDALLSQQLYYGSGVRAYTENTYEQSSRGRIISSSLPGFTETTTISTQGSTANTILNLSYNAGTNTISASGYHSANRFTVTVTEGPDGSRTEIYTDELGTPALERVKLDTFGTYADTYYIRDALGRMVCVIPPAEALQLGASTTGFSASNCYTYAYDERDRVVSRHWPGSVTEAIAYNDADQPTVRSRMAADSNAMEVYTTNYDLFFRPVSETYKYGSNTTVTLAEYWYDSYPTGAPGFSAESGYVSSYDNRTKGMKTAERVALLPASVAPSGLTASNTSAKEFRAFYYDAKANVCQLARVNTQGGTDRFSLDYGFAGNLLKERQRIQPGSGQSAYTFDRTYTYDARLRLQTVSASLGGGPTALQTLTYDDLQRVSGISRASGASESTSMSYTLQGWLSATNSTSWEETLRYASPSRSATDALPGKAGLVTEWTQQQKGNSSSAETFAYAYDKAGRLTGSQRYVGSSTTADNGLTEQGISYDCSGNLTALTRRNASGTAIETISYSYSGPKRTSWGYDGHANVTADPQGGLSLAWNAIDLPRTISSSSATTQRGYLADGSLAQVSDGTTTRLYLGDLVFNRASNGTVSLESAGWEGGRLLAGSGADKVLYYVTDHLGSVRVVKDGSGTVQERFDYYPYGTVSRAWTSSTTDNSGKRFRFGGKEIAGAALTDLSGTSPAPSAPYLDFGARLYSPRTATWLSPDPMAEKYYGISPFVYCAGNPGNLVDPTGESTWVLRNNDGRYIVVGGELDDDLNVYVVHFEDGAYIKDYSVGSTAFSTSFFNEDLGKWMVNSIIDMNDLSAQSFMSSIVKDTPSLIYYAINARNNQVYDFKVSNGMKSRTDFDPYRGMLLGDAIVSARDVGNIAAGYVAGANGVPYWGLRLLFDAYQTITNSIKYNSEQIGINPIGYTPLFVPTVESKSSRRPQRAGWYAGSYMRSKMR